MRMRFVPGGIFPEEISNHRAESETGGKAHVFNDAYPIALHVLRFDIRGDDLDARLDWQHTWRLR